MEYTMKFHIYPNKTQRNLISRTFGSCRFVYNFMLDMRQKLYQAYGESMSYRDCSAQLPALKSEFEWLKDVDSTALQSAVKDLDIAFQNFFRGRQTGKRVGYPKFKSKKHPVQSYKTKSNIKLSEKAIRLPKLGWVKCRVSKQVSGRILNAIISRSASGKYFVSVCWTDVDQKPLPKAGQANLAAYVWSMGSHSA